MEFAGIFANPSCAAVLYMNTVHILPYLSMQLSYYGVYNRQYIYQ